MDGGANMLKEIDLQIVHERLKARKRNITGPEGTGKPPKKMLAEAYRGWYGYETRYNALLRMSNEATLQTKDKNDRLQLKHMVEMNHLMHEEKTADGKANKGIKAMREDFRSMLAYQYVYKSHSFKRYDKSREITRTGVRPSSDKTPIIDKPNRPSSYHKPRPLGSLREAERYKHELKFPPIEMDHKEAEEEGRSSKLGNDREMTGFPKIEEAMGVEIRYLRDEDGEESVFSLHTDTVIHHKPPVANQRTGLDMGQNLLRMKQLEQERYDRERLQTPKSEQPRKWRRVLPKTPPTRPNVGYPTQVKTPIALKKFVKKEVDEVMSDWNSDTKRKEAVEKAKAQEEPAFQIGERNRSTSAIMNDFRRYQEQKRRSRTEKDEQLMIVRQLSPVPREGSPKSQRMTDYSSRISSPFPYRKREGSEKFPSVSRTSSYRELPDGPIEIHENALLTAAERIEKEKEKKIILSKMAQIMIVDENEGNTDQKDEKSSVSRGYKSMPPLGKFNYPKTYVVPTAEAEKDTDKDPIATVQEANKQPLKKPPIAKRPPSRSSEKSAGKKKLPRQVYDKAALAALIQQQRLDSREHENVDQAWFSALSRHALGTRLSAKMKHDYDDFSRTPPETKKTLELRARKKRQKQLEKARLIDEMYTKKSSKETDIVSESDRPSTRVSFNENVLVYQAS